MATTAAIAEAGEILPPGGLEPESIATAHLYVGWVGAPERGNIDWGGQPHGGGCRCSPTVRDNVEHRLLAHFERSWERQEEARTLLPAKWLADTRPAAQQLNELFLDLLTRARERVDDEHEALAQRSVSVGDLRD